MDCNRFANYCKIRYRELPLVCMINDNEKVESQQLIPEGSFKSRRRKELIKLNTDFGNRLLEGTVSIEQFAEEQTERDLQKEAEAERDYLTGLLNRRGFSNRFEEKLLEFRRVLHALGEQTQTGTLGCLVLLDLDNFGSVNKEHGDSFGDSTLQQVAIALIENVRPEDLVARFGGEEFVIFLPGAKLENSIHVVERIRRNIPKQTAANLDNFRQTATFGLMQFPDNLTEEEIVKPESRERLFSEAYKGVIEAKLFAKKEGKDMTAVKKTDGTIEVITPIIN